MAKTYSPKPKGIQDQFRSECTRLLQPIKEDGDEVRNDDDEEEDESDNIGDGNLNTPPTVKINPVHPPDAL